ncbi:MAG: hypothetical protein HWE34_11870 [Methylocystaceae bacterium]|nr:hypothetical protein [Methylocystaceae bacterium]
MIKKLIYTSLLALITSCPAIAGDFKYSSFSQDIQYITDTLIAKCKDAGIGSPNNQHQLRKSCGEALRDQYFIGFDDSVFYKRQKTDNGFKDILGAKIEASIDGITYSVVRSVITEVQRPHNETEKVTRYADASLFTQYQGEWKLLLSFVNPHKQDWQKITPMFLRQKGIKQKVRQATEHIWRKYVVRETSKIAQNIKDATGPILTSE